MKDYIENVKKMFSCSDRIAIIFKDDESIWCNRNKDFFGGRFPLYNELKTVKIKKDNESVLSDVVLNIGNITLSGELYEEDNYSFALLDEKNIIYDAFEDKNFQQYIESNNVYIRTAITKIDAHATILRTREFKNEKERRELFDGLLNSLLGIMKTVQNNDIMIQTTKNYHHENTHLNIKEIFDQTVSALKTSCQNKIKIRCNVKDREIYTFGDAHLFRLLFLHVFRYMIFSSYLMEMSVNESIIDEDTVRIIFQAPRKERSQDFIMDFYDKNINFNMDEFIIHRLSEYFHISFEKKEDEKIISMSLQLKIHHSGYLNAAPIEEDNMKYSEASITFFDLP